jgi:signal transduction histidine kinase
MERNPLEAESKKNVASTSQSGSSGSCRGFVERFVLEHTLKSLLAVFAILIFFADILATLLFDFLPVVPDGWRALIDSTIHLIVFTPGYFCLFRPFILERKRSEEEIRRLSRQLIRSEEATRKRLARDLHDEFGQGLTVLQLGIETLKESLPADEKLTAAELCRGAAGRDHGGDGDAATGVDHRDCGHPRAGRAGRDRLDVAGR